MLGLELAVCQEGEAAVGEKFRKEMGWGRLSLLDFGWRPVRKPRIAGASFATCW